ncbi:MAG: cytidylate kinase-like family protein [Eubacterium sp.]|nr:cytidylate kinase-like family protein [Eubacterium sp.]
MKRNIITVSREFGSGGRMIGKMVAEKLGIAYYDKEIIAKVAEKTGFAEEFIERSGEYSPSKSIFAYAVVSRDAAGSSMDDYIFSVQRKIILELAEKGPCVIVGRCADDILSDREDSLHVFIYGNKEEKIKKIMKTHNVSEKEAAKLMKVTDKRRSINYNYYTDGQWGKAHNYDLCLNSSAIGFEACADAIVNLVK